MNLITSWMQSDWARALGWTFVHSLWQIALVGLALYLILRFIPGKSAHTRYTISTMGLWLIVVMALSTFIIMLPEPIEITTVSGQVVMVNAIQQLTWTDKLSVWLEQRMPMMLTIWSTGVVILMIRLAFSMIWISHIKSTSTQNPDLQATLGQLLKKLKLKVNPKAADSLLVPSPLTAGHLKPMILFPIGVINQLTPSEVEAILTHELAHIVRKDYLSNLVQSFIETIFYYHPVTWWISGTVRAERENRADDLAVAWFGDHLEYARALMTVQELNTKRNTSLALGFASRKGAMLARIQRILNVPYKNHHQMEKTVLLSLSSLCFLAFTFSGKVPGEQEKAATPAAEKTLTIEVIKSDSIPSNGVYRIHKKTDTQEIVVEVEDGDIKELKVDGKEINPSEYEAYAPVIDELFGGMEAPRAAEMYGFVMPDIPSMPEMPFMIEGFNFEMPEIPEIPSIPEFNFDYFFDDGQIMITADSFQWNGEQNISMFTDSLPNGQTRIIIYSNGDTSVICTPGQSMHRMEWNDKARHYRIDAEQMRQHMQIERETMREMNEQMRDQQRQYGEEQREMADEMRKQQRELHRQEMLRQLEAFESNMAPYRVEENLYMIGTPHNRLTYQLEKDGLIQPGEEAEVQLTPDKMKINGEKMPSTIHEKYLKLYEQQQGVELSGNSKVEFKTKSTQRM
jgi:beta-lactamase regulating signal transducer with metallopeptidase domain